MGKKEKADIPRRKEKGRTKSKVGLWVRTPEEQYLLERYAKLNAKRQEVHLKEQSQKKEEEVKEKAKVPLKTLLEQTPPLVIIPLSKDYEKPAPAKVKRRIPKLDEIPRSAPGAASPFPTATPPLPANPPPQSRARSDEAPRSIPPVPVPSPFPPTAPLPANPLPHSRARSVEGSGNVRNASQTPPLGHIPPLGHHSSSFSHTPSLGHVPLARNTSHGHNTSQSHNTSHGHNTSSFDNPPAPLHPPYVRTSSGPSNDTSLYPSNIHIPPPNDNDYTTSSPYMHTPTNPEWTTSEFSAPALHERNPLTAPFHERPRGFYPRGGNVLQGREGGIQAPKVPRNQCLVISGIHHGTLPQDLERVFAGFGQVDVVHFLPQSGLGVVKYEAFEEAELARDYTNRALICGSILRVEWASTHRFQEILEMGDASDSRRSAALSHLPNLVTYDDLDSTYYRPLLGGLIEWELPTFASQFS